MARVRLAVLGGADECVRPYIACGNALFATVHSWLDFAGRSARATLSSQMFAPEHWFLAYSTCHERKSESHC
jgi:hypothetical protein